MDCMIDSSKRKIAVAMSGGVDSSVSAALLLEEGFEAIGVTLQLQGAPPGGGHDATGDAIAQARMAAKQLGMQHFVLDCADDFERLVLRPAWGDYVSARTPSPCLRCNEGIKFGRLLDYALEKGCEALATGHYGQLRREGGQVRLLRGKDKNKDQTYFLVGFSQAQLSRLVFPLGGRDKPWVREKAASLGLHSAKRKESQDACFIAPGLSFPETLRGRFGADSPTKSGHIVDWGGKRIGSHEGIHNFTIGQRRGVKVGTGSKAWVCGLDPQSGDVRLTNDEQDLLCSEICVSGLSWMTLEAPAMPLECEVQVRYRSAPIAATVHDISGNRGKVVLHSPARAAAPGQAAAFYDGDCVLGRGWIERTGN
jgi:tRNA-specific 2-thiouridylase